jgi:TIR domain
MGGIFISYRRQESAGHAGRIRDRLRQRFGDRVFQDVDSIADGELFETVIDRALDTCEAALVVIGRHWLDCADAAGRRCLDNPEDWVRTEARVLLRRGIRVIPVLVGGAAMPAADALPEDIRPLVKRQAREIRDSSWDSDIALLVQRLEEILLPQPGAPARVNKGAAVTSAARRARLAAGLLIALALGTLGWWLSRGGPAQPNPLEGTTTHPSTAVTSAGSGAKTPASGPRGSESSPTPLEKPQTPSVDGEETLYIEVPPPGVVKLGTIRYDIRNVRLQPEGTDAVLLVFGVRMHNGENFPLNFWNRNFRLIVDKAALEPVQNLNEVTESRSARDGAVAFLVPRGTRRVTLQIKVQEEMAEVPFDLQAHTAPPPPPAETLLAAGETLPLALPAGQTVRVGGLGLRVLSVEVDRRNYDRDRLEVRVSLRATNRGPYPAAFGNSNVRVLVDGVPRAPAAETQVSEVVESEVSKEGRFLFVIEPPAESLALGFVSSSDDQFTQVRLLPRPQSPPGS